jgi:hypothetical protein
MRNAKKVKYKNGKKNITELLKKNNKRYTALSGPLELMYSDQVLQAHEF